VFMSLESKQAARARGPHLPVRAGVARRRVLARSCLLASALVPAFACARPDASRAPIVAVDDFGDTLRLAAPAARVVSLNPVTTEFLFAIGAGDRLVGRTTWDLYPEAARAVPDLGNGMQPNVEAVLGQRPDLVVLYASASNRAAVEQLRRAGVMTLTLRTDRVADLPRMAPILGEAVGRREAGIAAADSVLQGLTALRETVAPVPRPRVFWHIWDAPVLTIGSGSYLSELLVAAGGENVFADIAAPSPQVAIEEVARRNPDVVLAGPRGAETLRTHAAWRAIPAVRAGRILVVDTTLVGRPGVRMHEAARHLRALLATLPPR
jgi:iron complex transport system substrate-binding protein